MDNKIQEICAEIIKNGAAIRDYVLTAEEIKQVHECVNSVLKIW